MATRRLIFAKLALFAAVQVPHQASAQFTDPHSYDNTPVGTNQIEVSYAYLHANASIDSSLVITGAKIGLNQATIDYTHYFSVIHRVAWVQGAVPVARLGGSINGTNINGSVTGLGDSSYQAAMLLKGGPALNTAQFDNYQPTTTLGVSLTVTAPTGSYDANKILNLGSDRWSFKPELAISRPFGPKQSWQVELYANAYFYTDNTSYHGRQVLSQEPLPGLEGHFSHAFHERLWLSLDTRYSFRATTFVDRVDQKNPQRNFILGAEVNVSLNHSSSLVFELGKALVHQNGPAISGLSIKYDYTWAKRK